MTYRITVVATGQELLYGTTVDTNSAFISSSFFGTNFSVISHISVGDEFNDLRRTIADAIDKSDVVITTGGLGPTDDDNTVRAMCDIFGLKETVHGDSLMKMRDRFERIGRKPYPTDEKMVSVPDGAFVLENTAGISPGFVIRSGEKCIASMPGVPREMRNMFESYLLPYLKENYVFSEGMRLSYRVTGIAESEINKRINDMNLHESISWGVSAKSSFSELTFIFSDVCSSAKSETDSMVKEKFGNVLLGDGFASPEDELVFMLKSEGLTISTAESCTGGLIGKRLTDISGVSDVYMGSVIAYSNAIKSRLLNVNEKTITEKGAVSHEVAEMMAEGLQRVFDTDISVSTTGIAGPGGGSDEKPVGTVYASIRFKNNTETKRLQFSGSRSHIRESTATAVFNILRDKISSNSADK